jgi:AraC-like DNA-binding protein
MRGVVEETAGGIPCQGRALSIAVKPAGARHSSAFGTRTTILSVMLDPDTAAARLIRHWAWLDASVLSAGLLGLFAAESAGTRADPQAAVLVLLQRGLALGRAEPVTCPPAWLEQARARMERAAAPVQAVARGAGVHRGTLAREFRRHYGLAPTAHLRWQRVRRAAVVTAESSVSLAAVALTAGYSDQSHMSREFRRLLGITPGQFRQLVHSAPGP